MQNKVLKKKKLHYLKLKFLTKKNFWINSNGHGIFLKSPRDQNSFNIFSKYGWEESKIYPRMFFVTTPRRRDLMMFVKKPYLPR